jgi:ABC-type antimicrobial peptide transport system permease subunit
MSLRQILLDNFGRRDVVFALTLLLAFGLLIPVQLGSMILFDGTGYDTLVPDFVFMIVVPTLVLTVIPTVAVWRLYTRETGRVAAVAFVVFAAVTAYAARFYAVCGPSC